MMERFPITVKDIIRQENGLHTIVFTDGRIQPNTGVCLHGDMVQSDGARYYMIGFEVVPEYNPIIEVKS